MKKDTQTRIIEAQSKRGSADMHEVFSDAEHYVVSRITPDNVRKVLTTTIYDVSEPIPYTFFSEFSTTASGESPIAFFGQARRHEAFENAIQEKTQVQELLFRGQLQVDQDGLYHLFSFFDLNKNKYFSSLTSKQLRKEIRRICSKIDPSVMKDRVIIQLNSNLYFIYLPKARILKKFPDATIGTMRYD